MDYSELSQCVGKIQHKTRAKAHEHLAGLKKRGTAPGHEMVVYKCAHCDWFHVGRECKDRRKAIRSYRRV